MKIYKKTYHTLLLKKYLHSHINRQGKSVKHCRKQIQGPKKQSKRSQNKAKEPKLLRFPKPKKFRNRSKFERINCLQLIIIMPINCRPPRTYVSAMALKSNKNRNLLHQSTRLPKKAFQVQGNQRLPTWKANRAISNAKSVKNLSRLIQLSVVIYQRLTRGKVLPTLAKRMCGMKGNLKGSFTKEPQSSTL